MKRFFGMSLALVLIAGGLMLLSAGFYWVAGLLGWAFNGLGHLLGVIKEGEVGTFATYAGVSVGNVLTLMMIVLMISGSLLTVAERKWSALLQNRIGANRITIGGSPVGGIPYLAADALKMLTKERIEPIAATRFLYELAPIMAFAPVFCLFAIVPVGPAIDLGAVLPVFAGAGQTAALQVAKIDTGLLYLFAIASLQVYGTSLAGWASNNKLALLGGVRASSQMISYEVSLGLSLVGIPFLIADAVKMLTKERFQPAQATQILFRLAPVLAFAPVFALFAIIPVGPELPLGAVFGGAEGALGRVGIALQISAPDAGLLY
ncbi:MAG TPA: NADH-quinone oxidoreductase subunit H, partial [Anaeromyxobacteraceae bacterium]|nr:NADH-quinone oxidoreductase subunit H [Anaeromyxobacteraceae bacterium]